MKKETDYLLFIDYEFDQDKAVYKVNTDTVFLGRFLDNLAGKTVLDIGTNSGALLLYAHNKSASYLYGVDIHEDALKLAEKNISKYTNNYQLFNCRVQDLKIDRVDTIICNPPFFEMNNVTDDKYIKETMFEESLPLSDLFAAIKRLLKANGMAYLIYQADRFPELFNMCIKYKFKIMKMQFIHDINSKHALRVLVKIKIGPMSKLKVEEPILLNKGKIVKVK